jgi:hypothetical protein
VEVVTHVVVKVVFLCPEDHEHVLGAVSRQVQAVPQSDAGSWPTSTPTR